MITTQHQENAMLLTTSTKPDEQYARPIAKNDPVEHPAHYTQGGIECIDAIEASLGDVGFRAFCKGNVTKYLWRYEHKAKPLEDLKKARWYLDRLIKSLTE